MDINEIAISSAWNAICAILSAKMSAVYQMKRSNSMIDPCSTPAEILWIVDSAPSILTLIVVLQVGIHAVFCSLDNSPACHTLSKPFAKSSPL